MSTAERVIPQGSSAGRRRRGRAWMKHVLLFALAGFAWTVVLACLLAWTLDMSNGVETATLRAAEKTGQWVERD